jgi:hypothetical protein
VFERSNVRSLDSGARPARWIRVAAEMSPPPVFRQEQRRPRSALAAVRNLDNRSVASLQSVQSCSSCVSFQRPRLGLSGEHAVSQSTAVLGPAHIAGRI